MSAHFTHAFMLIPLVKSKLFLSATLTYVFNPSNCNDFPIFPSTHTAPVIVPVEPLRPESPALLPVPSFKCQLQIKGSDDGGGVPTNSYRPISGKLPLYNNPTFTPASMQGEMFRSV